MNTAIVDCRENPTDQAAALPASQTSSQRATRAARHKVEHQQLRRAMNPKALAPTDGNKRKSGRGKPSSKEKENAAQQAEGITVDEEGNVILSDTLTGSQNDQGIRDVHTEVLSVKDCIIGLGQQLTEVAQQNKELKLHWMESLKQNEELRKHIEELEIQMHQLREQRVTGTGDSSYLSAAMRGARATNSGEPPIRPSLLPLRSEELFCTIDFSRAEGGENAVNIPELREKIDKEIQQSVETSFKCRAITRDHRTQHRVRILCRSEKELDIVKNAATTVVTEGARILRDQLYPIKVNNARTDAVLLPSGELREDIVSALNDGNDTQVAKVSWLSSRHARKAYGSMVVFLKKRSEAERFLYEGYIDVGGESASVRVFEPSFGPPRCYNCQGTEHKAYSCKEAQRCGNCAETGHSWNDCKADTPKCALCSGPHSVASRNCLSPNGS